MDISGILEQRIFEKTGIDVSSQIEEMVKYGYSRLELCKEILSYYGVTMGLPPSRRRANTKRMKIDKILNSERLRNDIEIQGFVSFLSKLDLYDVCMKHKKAFLNDRCPEKGCEERLPAKRPALFFRIDDDTAEIYCRIIDDAVLMLLNTDLDKIKEFVERKAGKSRKFERKALKSLFRNVLGTEITVTGYIYPDKAFGRTLVSRFFEFTDINEETKHRKSFKSLKIPDACNEVIMECIR